MWHSVGIVGTDVSEEHEVSIFKVERLSELGTLAVTSRLASSLILSTLEMEGVHSSETSVLTRATRRHFPEDGILDTYSPPWNPQSYWAFKMSVSE
jgi:hypothetical protein